MTKDTIIEISIKDLEQKINTANIILIKELYLKSSSHEHLGFLVVSKLEELNKK